LARERRRFAAPVIGSLLAAAGLLGAQGCAPPVTAAVAATRPAGTLTLAVARQAFSSWKTVEDLAMADGNEPLALSISGTGQAGLVTAEFDAADYLGTPLPRYQYKSPVFYVPRLRSYPQWFVVTADRQPLKSKQHSSSSTAAGTAVLVFERLKAGGSWLLSESSLLLPGTAVPGIALDSGGYATALATFDQALAIRPDIVGPMQAAVVDGGPASAAAKVVDPGPLTTGLYTASAAQARHAATQGESYQWELEGTAYPQFVLRTTDGGAVVLYSMYLNTVTDRTTTQRSTPAAKIAVPAGYASLLLLKQSVLTHQLTANQTLDFIALDPPGKARNPKIKVFGDAGGPTYASGF
jgi:hypothetical protein